MTSPPPAPLDVLRRRSSIRSSLAHGTTLLAASRQLLGADPHVDARLGSGPGRAGHDQGPEAALARCQHAADRAQRCHTELTALRHGVGALDRELTASRAQLVAGLRTLFGLAIVGAAVGLS